MDEFWRHWEKRGIAPIHTAVPGRARLQVKGLYRSRSFQRLLERYLQHHSSIDRVSANPRTGAVLVIYQADIALDVILDHIARARTAESETDGGGITPWHACDAPAVLEAMGTDLAAGLSERDVWRRRRDYGANSLPPPPMRSRPAIFADQFRTLPVGLLAVSAVVSLITGGAFDAVIILGVVAVNGVIGYITEAQAERAITDLNGNGPSTAVVLRDGRAVEIPGEEVVPGDLQVLEPGRMVAADGRIVVSHGLTIDESILTGESVPAAKTTAATPAPQPLADRAGMAFRGTVVSGGTGLAVVVATGRHTEIGLIQGTVAEVRAPATPMQRQLDGLGRRLVLASAVLCGLMVLLGLLRGQGVLQMLRTGVALAVAAIPEGLPTVATTTLALSVRDMRRYRMLVRKLAAVETLGSVQVICFDKTGTLTLNSMSVVEMHAGMRRYRCDDDLCLAGREMPELHRLIEAAVLCNDATACRDSEGAWMFEGSSTEVALLRIAEYAGMDIAALRWRWPRLEERRRGERRQSMVTLHAESGQKRLIAVKGSPPEVLAMCRRILVNGEERLLDAADRQALAAENIRMAGDGLRVLGVAFAEGAAARSGAAAAGDMTWLGLVGMHDPMRAGLAGLMARLHRAGIKTVMLTGDQPATAAAIARDLGLGGNGAVKVLDARHLDAIPPDRLDEAMRGVQVFARISPADKLRIVQAHQAAGLVVAMTGDGVNDAPALKAADVGIAMGARGTEAARSLADMVLEKDDLEAMAVAIERGRTIYANIRKSVHFLLATNLSEIIVMVLATAAGFGQPLSPGQLLWINLVSDVFPGLALSQEPPEPETMRQSPRPPAESIVPATDLRRMAVEGGIISAGSLAAYGYGLARGGGERASAFASSSLVVAQLLHALTCRSARHGLFASPAAADGRKLAANPMLTLAVGASLAAQAAGMLPPFRRLLGLAPLGLADAAVVAAAGIAPYLLNEGVKAARNQPRGIRPQHDAGDAASRS